ncbi:conserved Plasmodium protein, unknown function [Plasmodium yoelii]|uniref:Uncharacterized protein n=2 Tax=Plasmodium yoelii TaxID=5861 RepID=A0AAE9WML1_PLAYO|nr:conserved Plasmodium protein, unknown function [Plasmodium yoelii]WBY56545.1 hypothetical protein Py17XNL_000801614 [Plasmodium yoelii yoelii]CDU17408.1 conserved Plasmodium protein, unknown function [Plasmodium yoelii]VTZ77092.1 conserved Plasmodium protein, unknown function [Plasmodium yoelii]|eukprot:XP_725967.2 conserved Plasmodium protein, unknown function [Plasmodium yoelii]
MNDQEKRKYAKVIENVKYFQNENILLENLNVFHKNNIKKDNNIVIELIDIFLDDNNYCNNENFLFDYNLLKTNKEINLNITKKNKSKIAKQFKINVKNKHVEKVNEDDIYYFALKSKNICNYNREFLNAKKILFEYICNGVLEKCVDINYLIDRIYVDFQLKKNNTYHLIRNNDIINILIETIYKIFINNIDQESNIYNDEDEENDESKTKRITKNQNKTSDNNIYYCRNEMQKSYLTYSKEQRKLEGGKNNVGSNESINYLELFKILITIDKSFVKNIFYIFLKNIETLKIKKINKVCNKLFIILKHLISYLDEFEIGTIYNIFLSNDLCNEINQKNNTLYNYIIMLCLINLRNVYNTYNMELCMNMISEKLIIDDKENSIKENLCLAMIDINKNEEENQHQNNSLDVCTHNSLEEETDEKKEDFSYNNNELDTNSYCNIENEKDNKITKTCTSYYNKSTIENSENGSEFTINNKEINRKHIILFILIFALKIYDISYINGCVHKLIKNFFHLLKKSMHFMINKVYHIIKTIIFILLLVFSNLNINNNETVVYILKCIDILLKIYYKNLVFNEEYHEVRNNISGSNSNSYAKNHKIFEKNTIELNNKCANKEPQRNNNGEENVEDSYSDEINIFEFNISPILLFLIIHITLEYNLNKKYVEDQNSMNHKIMSLSLKLKEKWMLYLKNYNRFFLKYLIKRDKDIKLCRNNVDGNYKYEDGVNVYIENLSIINNIRNEIKYLTKEVDNFFEEDILNILCLNNILFYIYEMFNHIDLIYLIRFFNLCKNVKYTFCCINIEKVRNKLDILLKLNTKLCINTFENLKIEYISKCSYIYINALILSLFEYNLIYVFKFISYYCLINSSELIKFLPALLFIYNLPYDNCYIDNTNFKIKTYQNVLYYNQRNFYRILVIRSLILHALSKIGCSDSNIPIIYNCVCILLNKNVNEIENKTKPSTLEDDNICNEKNMNYEQDFSKLHYLYCYDKLIDSNENIMSKYFKYIETILNNPIESSKESEKKGSSFNKFSKNDYIENDTENDILDCVKQDLDVLFDLKNLLILLKLSRFYNVSNYIDIIIKLISTYFRKYKNKVKLNNVYNKIQNNIIKISILVLVALSLKKYVEFEIIYNLLKKNFLKNNDYSDFNVCNTNILCSVIIFTRYYINYLVYKKKNMCNEEYDILYHTKIKYIFKDFSKLINLNNEKISEELINLVSSIYSIYYKNNEYIEAENVKDGIISNLENGTSMKTEFDVENNDRSLENNNMTYYLNFSENSNLMSLYYDKRFVHESFLKCKKINIYEKLQKVILTDEINNISLYNLKNNNKINNNHLIRVLYKLFNKNIKNDSNSNFNYYVKLLFTENFNNIDEIIGIFKNLHFFNDHYINLFFYIIECFFEKLKSRIKNKEEFIISIDDKTNEATNLVTRKKNKENINTYGNNSDISKSYKETISNKGSEIKSIKKEKEEHNVINKKVKQNLSHEIICNKIYEETKKMINDENLNIYVFYPILCILCKYNSYINEVIDFFLQKIDMYMKENDTKLKVVKNEMIISLLCLNYIHINISEVPQICKYLIGIYKEASKEKGDENRYIKNTLLFCLSSCCHYTNLSTDDIITILNMHIENLEYVLNFKSWNNDETDKNGNNNYTNYNQNYVECQSNLNMDYKKEEINNLDKNEESLKTFDDLYFFISINNLCFYLYKHYNNTKFDELIKHIYNIIINYSNENINNVIITITNIMMYLYIKKIINIYDIIENIKIIINHVRLNIQYNSKYVVYGMCSFYRFINFYLKKYFGYFSYETDDGKNEVVENVPNNNIRENSNEIKYDDIKEIMKMLSNRVNILIEKYFDELEDKNISFLSYFNLIGLKSLGECMISDCFDSFDCSNMTILFINRFIKKHFEIKKSINATNKIFADSDSSSCSEDNKKKHINKEIGNEDIIDREAPEIYNNLFIYNNNNHKLNNDIIISDNNTILIFVYLFCHKYYEELNCSLIKIENLDKNNMLYYLFSNLMCIENYLRKFLQICKIIDIEEELHILQKNKKKYEDIKLNMTNNRTGNKMYYLNFFSDELYDNLNIFLNTMKLINYIKFDVQIKNIILNIYSFICKFITILYIILDIIICNIEKDVDMEKIKSFYKIYEEVIKKVQLLYECRISIFNYFSIYSVFNSSYNHIFCNFSNNFYTLSTYEKYMFIKSIINFKKIKKEEIKFIFLNIFKNLKLFHQDTSLWIYTISILKILLKKIYISVKKKNNKQTKNEKNSVNYDNLGSYIKLSFVTLLEEAILAVYKEKYYSYYSLSDSFRKIVNENKSVEYDIPRIEKHDYNISRTKLGNYLNGKKSKYEIGNDYNNENNGLVNKKVINDDEKHKILYLDMPFSIMMCISDFVYYLCKLIVKEQLENEINIDELIKNCPILIQGYVRLKFNDSYKKLNMIRNKILFHTFEYNFTFKENFQNFYYVEESCKNNKKLLTLKFNYQKLTEYFQTIFLIKECIYLSYIYSQFSEKQQILDNLLQMCDANQINKEYLYILITSFTLFSFKNNNSSFFINKFMYNFDVANYLVDGISTFLFEKKIDLTQRYKNENSEEGIYNYFNVLNKETFQNNTNGNVNKKLISDDSISSNQKNNVSNLIKTKEMSEEYQGKDINISKIFYIIEEELIRTKMRNSFFKHKNKLLKEENLTYEKFLENDMFFLKKLGIFYLIKNNEGRTNLRDKYKNILSFFSKNEKDDIFIKTYDICNLNDKDIEKYACTQDIIDNSYYNNNSFNKKSENNSFVSDDQELVSKYFTVPLFMKDVFTFFELSLNKNIILNNFNELFYKNIPNIQANKKENEKKNKDNNNDDNNNDCKDDENDSCSLISDDENNVDKILFDEKRNKKKKILFYDNAILNYLSIKPQFLNNFELYIANVSFISKLVRSFLIENNSISNKINIDENSNCNGFSHQFYLIQAFFNNLSIYFMSFTKGFILNNSEYLYPNSKLHLVYRVINFLCENYTNKYS